MALNWASVYGRLFKIPFFQMQMWLKKARWLISIGKVNEKFPYVKKWSNGGGGLQIGRTDATETVTLLWKYSGVCHSNEHSESMAGNVNSELQTWGLCPLVFLFTCCVSVSFLGPMIATLLSGFCHKTTLIAWPGYCHFHKWGYLF